MYKRQLYDTADAIALVKKSAVAKFDETIEAHLRTGCDGRHADQQDVYKRQSLEFCPDCMRHPRAFEYGIALLNYDETARHSMAQIKYNNKREYLDFYGTALAARYGRTIRRMQARCV